jgi:hypothetical protein
MKGASATCALAACTVVFDGLFVCRDGPEIPYKFLSAVLAVLAVAVAMDFGYPVLQFSMNLRSGQSSGQQVMTHR